MAGTTANTSALLRPETVNALIVQPVIDQAVATIVSTVARTTSHQHCIPTVTDDPAASWIAEGAEIPTSDLEVSEVVVTPAKLAGLSIISAELADDSSPAAQEAVGQGLARDIARKLDAAYFGDVAAPAPSGLEALAGTATVDAGAGFTDLDAFLTAMSLAETVGARTTAFVCNPLVALSLATIKAGPGSNVALLQPDPTAATGRTIAGVPLYTSPAVAPGTVWAIPSDRTLVVIRDGATVEVDRSVYFTSDRVAVRAIMRVGFGFPHPGAVVKIATSG